MSAWGLARTTSLLMAAIGALLLVKLARVTRSTEGSIMES